MKLVVEIDEETYKDIKKGKVYSSFRDVPQESVLAIANGIPLPKHYGRLVDADALMKVYSQFEFSSDMRDAMEILDHTPTIIEADKAESEG